MYFMPECCFFKKTSQKKSLPVTFRRCRNIDRKAFPNRPAVHAKVVREWIDQRVETMDSDKPFPFEEQELLSPSWFQALLGRQPRENATILINNLMAHRSVRKIPVLEVADIFRAHGVNLQRHLRSERLDLYRKYLKHCLQDHHLSDVDLDDLHHLRELLALEPEEAERVHDAAAGEVLRGAYDALAEQDQVHQEQVDFLVKLQSDLRIPDRLAESILSEKRTLHIQGRASQIAQDGRISPQEWEDLESLARVLHVSLDMAEKDRLLFNRMKMLWLLENGEMPEVASDLFLKRGETCHFMGPADWLESRTITQRVNYSGLGYRVRIMKGLYWQGGSMGLQRITSEEIVAIDSGTLYVTNKRILFNGVHKNMNLPLGRVIDLVPYSDAVGIEKDRGRSPIFRVEQDAEILAVVLGRVLDGK